MDGTDDDSVPSYTEARQEGFDWTRRSHTGTPEHHENERRHFEGAYRRWRDRKRNKECLDGKAKGGIIQADNDHAANKGGGEYVTNAKKNEAQGEPAEGDVSKIEMQEEPAATLSGSCGCWIM